jgi:hypothetical protein
LPLFSFSPLLFPLSHRAFTFAIVFSPLPSQLVVN